MRLLSVEDAFGIHDVLDDRDERDHGGLSESRGAWAQRSGRLTNGSENRIWGPRAKYQAHPNLKNSE